MHARPCLPPRWIVSTTWTNWPSASCVRGGPTTTGLIRASVPLAVFVDPLQHPHPLSPPPVPSIRPPKLSSRNFSRAVHYSLFNIDQFFELAVILIAQVLVLNQFSNNNLMDGLHASWDDPPWNHRTIPPHATN